MKKLFKLLAIACCLLPLACFAQRDCIGRKINPYLPKPISERLIKSGKSIPSLTFKFDSIRQLSEITTGHGEAYPSISSDGNRIYYTEATRKSSNPPLKTYMADKQPGQYKFSNPRPLSINSNDTLIDNWSAWLTNDELNIYFTQFNNHNNKSTLFHAKRYYLNQDFSTPLQVNLIGKILHQILGPSLTQDSMYLYIYDFEQSGTKFFTNIYIYIKTAVNEYSLEDTLKIPSGFLADPGTLSQDGLKYFFSLEQAGISRLFVYFRDSLNQKFNRLYYINNQYINDSIYNWEGTPYFSLSNNILVFIKGLKFPWKYDSLYIAFGFKEFENIIENIKKSGNVNIYPNPVENYLEVIPVEIYHSFDYYLFNLSGQIIKVGSFICNIRLDVSSFTKGLYILKLIDKKDNMISFHKVLKI